MNGSPEVIEFLNDALSAELAAINQYFAHSKLCENWGYKRLAHKYREESIDEMRDAETLIDRILLLNGMPNLQRMGPVRVGETVLEQLDVDLQLEYDAVARYRAGIMICSAQGDPGTREMLEDILVGEEQHADWIETQQRLIADVGIELYQQAQIHHDS